MTLTVVLGERCDSADVANPANFSAEEGWDVWGEWIDGARHDCCFGEPALSLAVVLTHASLRFFKGSS
jgi:hypothetical protein